LSGRASDDAEASRGARADEAGVLDLLSVVGKYDQQSFDQLKLVLFAPPRLSRMLRDEVILFIERHAALKNPRDLLADVFKQHLGTPEQQMLTRAHTSNLVAKDFVDHLDTKRWEKIWLQFRLRKEMLLHFWRMRQLAKLDALEQRWPELAQDLRQDMAWLQEVERRLLDPATEADARQALEGRYPYADDLVALLRLRPHFKEIDAKVLETYFKAAQAVAKSVAAAEPGPAQPKVATPQAAEARPRLNDLRLSIQPVEPAADANADEETYHLVLKYGEAKAEDELTLDWVALLNALHSNAEFTYGYSTRDIYFDQSAQPVRAFNVPQRNLNEMLKAAGQTLYSTFFGKNEVADLLHNAIGSAARLRLVLDSSDNNQRVIALPWEALYVPVVKNFIALLPGYSFVRLLSTLGKPAYAPIITPLRILVLLSSPSDVPPLNITGEEAIIREVLRPAQDAHTVALEFCRPTLAALRDKLRVFKPDVFHFVGHGVFDQAKGSGALMFQDEHDGKGVQVDAEVLRSTLTGHGIRLGVFNACDTGTASTNDVITGVAGALVSTDITACIATTRAIVDEAALLFTREYYRSLVTGYSLEGALSEARRALRQEGHDWAAYSLFTNTTNLDEIALDLSRGQGAQEQPIAPGKNANHSAR
jgi:hypothetical protein